MSEDNHVSVMAIMSGSSSNIRISSCVNLFLGIVHFFNGKYTFSGKVSITFLRIMMCKYLQVSSFFEVEFWFTRFGLVWWDIHDPTCSGFDSAVWFFSLNIPSNQTKPSKPKINFKKDPHKYLHSIILKNGKETFPLKIYTFNAKCLRNKFTQLEILILEEDPEIIAIIETWLSSDIADSEFTPPHYTCFRKDRRINFTQQAHRQWKIGEGCYY